jgi:DNA-binding response OmpR family regulator
MLPLRGAINVTAYNGTHDSPVLIISPDPLLAALVGLLVELEGHRLAFAGSDESAVAALRRTSPRLVLVDADHPDSFSEGFLTDARRHGARVVIFSPATRRELREQARERGLAWLALPSDNHTFARTLAEALVGTP